ncbi:MAG: hypothetical protein JSW58_00400 [Candidatus Latescibacterota bacterium]|nr:MAG: hypothetical protein JSW58_00400 [Candidatus Latescibacterota bacterium]
MKWPVFFSFAMALFLCSPATFAEDSGTKRIVFLNLTLEGDEIRLDNIKIADGTLKLRKRFRLVPNHLYFAVTSALGETLYEDTVADPSFLRVEYEDAEGNLQIKTARRDVTNFAIRIPYDKNAHRIAIHRIGAETDGIDRMSWRSDPIGSFVIDLPGGTDEE